MQTLSSVFLFFHSDHHSLVILWFYTPTNENLYPHTHIIDNCLPVSSVIIIKLRLRHVSFGKFLFIYLLHLLLFRVQNQPYSNGQEVNGCDLSFIVNFEAFAQLLCNFINCSILVVSHW